ncbi:universal stress protein [Arthrobacter agilis]|uniref:universal stress protein n=1 Tax=Arthrobacter agilis TaxID=37921 RepID=UPI002366958B|nr:universal stress protein [Arthrobacter agilis]WDF31858.1 universal stress protein [Arthrobacter agilis]
MSPAAAAAGTSVSGTKPVIVAYDGSEGSQQAVLWAVRHAAKALRQLVVVHCWVWPFFTKELGPIPEVQDSGLRRAAESPPRD